MKRILIVDDNADIRLSLRFLLRDCYDVFEASNGEVALQILEAERMDIMLLDMLMPVRDGESTIKELRRRNWNVPVIVMSAHDPMGARGQELGVTECLVKPFAAEELQGAIERLIGDDDEPRGGGGGASSRPGRLDESQSRGRHDDHELQPLRNPGPQAPDYKVLHEQVVFLTGTSARLYWSSNQIPP